MRAKEFISETKRGKLTKRQRESTRGLHIFDDGGNFASDYSHYRLGLALACADGKTPPDVPARSWIGRKKTAHPYSELEQEMLLQSYKAVGLEYQDVNHGDLSSDELLTINTASPVAKPKRNRYGV
jgi:hypothetical protein